MRWGLMSMLVWALVKAILLDGVAGAIYGWLFWRRNLEAAMMSHAATHLGMAATHALMT